MGGIGYTFKDAVVRLSDTAVIRISYCIEEPSNSSITIFDEKTGDYYKFTYDDQPIS